MVKWSGYREHFPVSRRDRVTLSSASKQMSNTTENDGLISRGSLEHLKDWKEFLTFQTSAPHD